MLHTRVPGYPGTRVPGSDEVRRVLAGCLGYPGVPVYLPKSPSSTRVLCVCPSACNTGTRVPGVGYRPRAIPVPAYPGTRVPGSTRYQFWEFLASLGHERGRNS
eukprot:1085255-Rhodomonas_salina.1